MSLGASTLVGEGWVSDGETRSGSADAGVFGGGSDDAGKAFGCLGPSRDSTAAEVLMDEGGFALPLRNGADASFVVLAFPVSLARLLDGETIGSVLTDSEDGQHNNRVKEAHHILSPRTFLPITSVAARPGCRKRDGLGRFSLDPPTLTETSVVLCDGLSKANTSGSVGFDAGPAAFSRRLNLRFAPTLNGCCAESALESSLAGLSSLSESTADVGTLLSLLLRRVSRFVKPRVSGLDGSGAC